MSAAVTGRRRHARLSQGRGCSDDSGHNALCPWSQTDQAGATTMKRVQSCKETAPAANCCTPTGSVGRSKAKIEISSIGVGWLLPRSREWHIPQGKTRFKPRFSCTEVVLTNVVHYISMSIELI